MSMYQEIIESLAVLAEVFEKSGIIYYIGGSVSSSLHGIARRSQDIDVIANIQPDQVHLLVKAL